MAAEHLSYNGINRSITDYAGSRACEELINLRPTSEGLMPVRPFDTMFSNKNFDRVFVHHAVGVTNYISVRHDSSNLTVSLLSSGGSGLQTLVTIPLVGSSSSEKEAMALRLVENLHFATAGNIILVSVCDKDDSVYGNWSYTWTGGLTRYKVTEANVPKLTVGVDDGQNAVTVRTKIPTTDSNTPAAEFMEIVQNGINAIQETDTELCIGSIIIAVAMKTKDGNTFWTDNWKIYDPLSKFGGSYPPEVLTGTSWWGDDFFGSSAWDDFFDKYDIGIDMQQPPPGSSIGGSLCLTGTKVKVTIGPLSNQSGDPNYWNKDTSMLKSVEIYASRPVPYVDPAGAYDGRTPTYEPALLPKMEYSKMEMEGQILYHQASIPMEELLDGGRSVPLKFGGNVQVTSETLRVDAGAVTRYGHLLSYNARFHYYDSVSKTQIGMPSFSGLNQIAFSSDATYIFVRWSDENGSRIYYMGSISGAGYNGANLTIAPSVNITEVILYCKYENQNHTAMYYESVCRMTPSSSYNFSVGSDRDWDSDSHSGTNAAYDNMINPNPATPTVDTIEQAAINVTEQYNPFVFRVEHSYLAPGRITDLVPQNFVVTDATYGREPLDVFTERGIYALIQGSGDILYAWFDPIDPMVAYGRAVPTEMGIFFLSGGSLYLCAGHRVTLVSDALMAGPHKYVRSAGPNGAYAKIAGSSGIVDMSLNVSAVAFETFARSGRLSYNRFRQEVYVSNPSYDYTYVLSLKYRQWFKVSQRLWQDEPASVIVSRPGTTSGYVDVLSLETEDTGSIKIHLQTRPFSMGYQYAHIHRALSMIRARLSGTAGDVAVLHLYGSDDLQNWTLLAYAKRSGSTTGSGDSVSDRPLYISQLRTPTAARSWRYYTICLTGQVPSAGDFQTDVGPFVVDYEAVVRRLG